jgi:Holliday junction DNA helicase RuvA
MNNNGIHYRNIGYMDVAVQEEAVAALSMPGFAASASQKAVIAILKEEPEASVEKVIKSALKRL